MSDPHEKATRAHQLLETAVAALQDTDAFRAFLQTQARFHHYSFGNTILIHAQRPGSTRVAGYRAWQALGRQVRKGEHGITIFVPYRTRQEDPTTEATAVTGFGTATVFDIEQTDGDPLPQLPQATQLHTASDQGAALLELLTQWCATHHVDLALRPIDGPELGSYSPLLHAIVVDSTLATDQQAKTLLHEVAHATLHRSGPTGGRPAAEVEAESVAFVVASALGLDTAQYSTGYVAGWAQDSNLLRESASTIQHTAHTLIDQLTQKETDP